jgi:hypothetical protein
MPIYNASNDPRQTMGSKPKKKSKGNRALRFEKMGDPVTPRQKTAVKAAKKTARKTVPTPPATKRQRTQAHLATARRGY